MALIKCNECGHDVSSRAKLCPNCGNPLDDEKDEIKEKKKCTCGYYNDNDAVFCENCGKALSKNVKFKCTKCGLDNPYDAVFCENCGNNLKKKKSDWNFDSTTLTITSLLTFLFGTLLFGSPEFVHDAPPFLGNIALGFVTLILGAIVLIHMFVKDGFNLQADINHLKRFRLSKFHVSILFFISSLFLFICVFPLDESSYLSFLILACSFIICGSVAIFMNWNKLGWIYEAITSIISLVLFIISFCLYHEGNNANSNFLRRAEHFIDTGRTNPGNDYFLGGTIVLLFAICFLVLFIIMVVSSLKKKKK